MQQKYKISFLISLVLALVLSIFFNIFNFLEKGNLKDYLNPYHQNNNKSNYGEAKIYIYKHLFKNNDDKPDIVYNFLYDINNIKINNFYIVMQNYTNLFKFKSAGILGHLLTSVMINDSSGSVWYTENDQKNLSWETRYIVGKDIKKLPYSIDYLKLDNILCLYWGNHINEKK